MWAGLIYFMRQILKGLLLYSVGFGQLEGKLRWLLGGRMVWRCIAADCRSESSLEVSEELPEWVQNCIPLVSWVFHLNYHCPTSTYCKSVSILLLCSLPDILPTSVYLPADQNPHYTIEATMDLFTYLRHK